MEKFIAAATKSFQSILSPGMLSIFVKSLLITMVALILFMAMFGYGISHLTQYLPWGSAQFFQQVLPFVLFFGAWLFAWMLFPAVLPLIIHFFDDAIIEIVEKENYPPVMRGENWPFWQEVRHDLTFMLKAILLNLLILPLYLIPGLNLIIFYVLNGYLIGNEFFMTVARRHFNLQIAKSVRKQNSGVVFISGVLITLLTTIPIINLLSPFFGVTLMTHLFHRQKLHIQNKRLLSDQK
jgi:CysZ protein